MKYFFSFLFLIFYTHASTLVMIGGGPRPKAALFALLNASTNTTPAVLVLPWGTEYPNESCDTIKTEFLSIKNIQFTCLLKDTSIEILTNVLKTADVLYFPGGDQNKIMEQLKKFNIIGLIKKRFSQNLNIGGTSAGTAIQSHIMLTGDESNVSQGLGLINRFVVDQHFLVRQRQERLTHVLKTYKMSGIGIDEGTAAIINNNELHVVGKSQVWIYLWPNLEKPITLNDGMMFSLSKN